MNALPNNCGETLRALTPAEMELIQAPAGCQEFSSAVIEYLERGNRVEYCGNGFDWDTQGWYFLWTDDRALHDFLVTKGLRVHLNEN